MTEMIFASQNGRKIPKEDKIFGISNRAKAKAAKEGKDKVVDACHRVAAGRRWKAYSSVIR